MSAQKLKPSGVLGGIAGLLGFSVLAGVLVTAMVTPALAVTSMTAQGSIDIFENLPNSITIGEQSQRNTIYANRDGAPVPLATIYKQDRQVVKWDDVSPFLKQAAVDGEDRRFYDHGGVDVQSLVRAAVNHSSGKGGGGSTIDMQLVKNILVQEAFTTLTGDAQKKAIAAANGITFDRKLKEMKLAIGLDKKYTKKEILLGYLNIVGMGSTTYGVESAAQQYFSVSAKDVTLPEAASLMAIVQQPSYNDLTTPTHYASNKERRDQILDAMLEVGHITQKQHDDAVATPIASYVKLSAPNNGCRTASDSSAAAACDYAVKLITADPVGDAQSTLDALKKLPAPDASNKTAVASAAAKISAATTALATAKANVAANFNPTIASMGATPAERLANWDRGGYQIYLSINLNLQDVAQAALNQEAPATETRFQLGATANTVEAGTGWISVMAQNKLWDNAATDNPATTSYNLSVDAPYGGANGYDTGSTYKVIDLANWLQGGHGLGDMVNGSGPYQTYKYSSFTASCDPGALGGSPFKLYNDSGSGGGNMTVKQALVGSVNNAFMHMAEKQDLCSIRDTAISMGAHLASYSGELSIQPAAILGTNEQAPLTMAGVAATIGAGGKYCSPIIIAKVVDPSGKTLAGQPVSCAQALTSDIAAGVANAMTASMQVGTSAPANPHDGIAIGGKTGTSSTRSQDWVMGTTTKVATSVWTGNIDSALTSLKNYTNPVTRLNYYAYSRFRILKPLMAAQDAAYGGEKAFPVASSAVLSGASATVPSLAGQTEAQALSVLSNLQFDGQDGGAEASALPVGKVTRTDPAAGAKAPMGSTVTVYTSDGSLSTTMPNVSGSKYKDALSAIASYGFNTGNVSVTWVAGTQQPNQPTSACIVQSSNPAAGAAASKTDPITLTVYGKPDGSQANCQ